MLVLLRPGSLGQPQTGLLPPRKASMLVWQSIDFQHTCRKCETQRGSRAEVDQMVKAAIEAGGMR